MTTVHTPMPIFNKPGPLRALLEERGFVGEWICASDASKGKAGKEHIKKALIERAPEIEYLIIDTTPLGAEFFLAAKKLKLIAMFGVGIDHISIPDATGAGVLITNAPGINSRCVSELVFAFMLDMSHKVTRMHTELVNGAWRPRLGFEISGKTLGIIGFGHIGQDMARIAQAFGMRVIFANRTPRPELACTSQAVQLPFDQVLAEADYLSVHIPGGPESWRFGAKQFAAMKKGAYFINAARGDIADLDALADALLSGHLAGAGLDVFPQEPPRSDHPVFSLPQVVVTPHAGGLSAESMAKVTASTLDEVVRVLKKERSPNACNPEVYNAWGGF